jgi:hypothetical protein
MSCQARILDEARNFPGTQTTYHTTKECGEEADYAEPIDDGDAHVKMCSPCFTRYKSKSNWYGWFDFSFPPTARILGSTWYYQHDSSDNSETDVSGDESEDSDDHTDEVEDLSVSSSASASASASAEEAEVDSLCEKFAEVTLAPPQQQKPLSKTDEIENKIKEWQHLLKQKGLAPSLVQKYYKELIESRTQLKKEKQREKDLKKKH